MSFRSDSYTTVSNRYKDWLVQGNAGENVTNRALTYINAAQAALNIYRPWKSLCKKRQSLTLTSKSATIPAACAKIILVYEDSDGDGKPDKIYYENSTRSDDGYYISPSFAKATGWTRTITFYVDPSSTIYLDYIEILTDFAGSGTEYSFFPGELLLAKAQELWLVDDGRTNTDEYRIITNRINQLITDFTENDIENFDPRMEILDDNGNRTAIESYSLSDGPGEGVPDQYDRDVDVR